MSAIVGPPSKFISDNDAEWVVNLDDGTSAVGVKYIDSKTKKPRIRREIVTRTEGDRLARFLEQRDKSRARMTSASNQ